MIVNLAKQMINNGDLILRTEKLAAQTKSLEHSVAMMLIKGDTEVTENKTKGRTKK